MKKILIVLFILSIVNTATAESWNIARTGGLTTDIFNNVQVMSDIAYCATDFGLVLMDVSDKENPVVHSRIETNGFVKGLELRDSLLYLCDGYAGLKIYSLHDPEIPLLIGECVDCVGAGRIILRDDYAYVSCGRSGMSVLDVSDPTTPEQIGRIGRECDGIALLDNYAYMGGNYINIIDIENPNNPELLNSSEYAFSGEMSVYNEILFGPLMFYSLENRVEPELIYRNNPIGSECHYLLDNILILFGGTREYRYPFVSCFNIENPESPELLTVCPVQTGNLNDLEYVDDFIFTTHSSDGFTICDFRDWDNPSEVSIYSNYANFRNIAVQGGYAYVLDLHGRIVTISLDDIENPEEVFTEEWDNFRLRTIFSEQPMVITENYLYMYQYFDAEDENGDDADRRGVYTYSLENPGRPELINELVLHGDHKPFDMIMDGDYLYANSYSSGLMVFSLENPEEPELIHVYDDNRQASRMDIEGNLIITCFNNGEGFEGINVWDIADPLNVEKIGELNTVEMDIPLGVAIFGDYVYLSGFDGNSSWIVSIEDPRNPRLLREFESVFHGSELVERDGILYMSCKEFGVRVYSLDDPEHPELAGFYDTPDIVSCLVFQEDNLFITDGSDLGVYDISRIQGLWYLELSAESHFFDSTAVDSTSQWELTLTNSSVNDREITDFVFEDTTFYSNVELPFDLSDDSDTTITIFFTPFADSLYSSTLSIISQEKEAVVALSGRGYLPNTINEEKLLPLSFGIQELYPNPFNSSININYEVIHPEKVTIDILDVSGRVVANLIDKYLESGKYHFSWDALNLPSGIYFTRYKTNRFNQNYKIMLIR